MAALSQWHQTQGFVDPAKAPQVKKVLKGIRALHPAPVKKAKPLNVSVLETLDLHLNETIAHGDMLTSRRALRDRALIWVGFWRGFRSDELVRLRIEHIQTRSGTELSAYLPHSKGDRSYQGKYYVLPKLNALCPAKALSTWKEALGENTGPVFRKIDRWGAIHQPPLNAGSVSGVLKRSLASAGIDNAQAFSSHSLRRGFAHWAASNQWDVNELMQYVGWQDARSALSYLTTMQHRLPQLTSD